MIHSSRITVKNPLDYEARSNIMWTATWALNTLVSKGKTTDCIVHMIGQSVGAYHGCTHGMTLSAVSMAHYRFLMPYGLAKFKRYAVNVWDVNQPEKPMRNLRRRAWKQMDSYMKELGLNEYPRTGSHRGNDRGIANGIMMHGG